MKQSNQKRRKEEGVGISVGQFHAILNKASQPVKPAKHDSKKT